MQKKSCKNCGWKYCAFNEKDGKVCVSYRTKKQVEKINEAAKAMSELLERDD